MKHLIFPSLLLAAAAMTSCAEDSATDLPISGVTNSNLITLDLAASATKGSDITADILQSSSNVVLSYEDADSATGTITFDYDSSSATWIQVDGSNAALDDEDALLWSEISYPIQLYSTNDGDDLSLTSYDSTSAATTYSVTEADDITAHKDLLFFSKTISSMPSAGVIRGVFDHALSKVEFTLTTTSSSVNSGYEVALLSAQFCQPYNDGTATITAADSSISWGDHSTNQVYYDYLNLKASTLSETSAEQIYTNVMAEKIEPKSAESEEWNMMLIPQEIAAGYDTLDELSSDTNDLTTVMEGMPYIEVLQRMEDEDGTSIAGASNATEYINSLDDSVFSASDKADAIATYKTTPLYVRVAFAFSDKYTLAPSTYYQLDLDFLSHGGIVTDGYYYDQTGTRTTIPIDDDLEVGEPVIGDADTQICLDITVSNWGEATTTSIN